MKWVLLVPILGLSAFLLLGCGGEGATSTPQAQEKEAPKLKQYSQPPAMTLDLKNEYTAIMDTTEGTITVSLLSQEAPKTVNNFVFLTREGYYDNVTFHRIVKDFMIQSGDPTGTGSGGPGYTFEDERVTRNYARGTLAMANRGPDTNGSQFFIIHKSQDMPKQFTIFGVVIFGMNVVDAIADTPVTASPTGELSRPTQDVIIKSIQIKAVDAYGSPG